MQNKASKLNNKLVSAGLGYTIGNYLIRGVNFVMTPVLTRLLTTDEYGITNVYVSYVAVVTAVIGLSFHGSIRVAAYRFPQKTDEYTSSIITADCLLLVVGMIGTTMFHQPLESISNLSTPMLYALLLQSFGYALLLVYNAYLNLNYQYKQYVLLSLAISLGNAFLSCLFMVTVYSADRVMGRILGQTVPYLLAGILIVVLTFKKARPQMQKDFMRFATSTSVPLMFNTLAQTVLSQFDRVMIQRIIGSSEAGLYSFAYNISAIIQQLGDSCMTVFITWFHSSIEARETKKIQQASTEFAEAILLVNILGMAVAPELVFVLAPRSYSASIYAVGPVIAAGYCAFLRGFPVELELHMGKAKAVSTLAVVAAVLNVILNLIFIPQYGYIAASYTTLASYVLVVLLHWAYCVRLTDIQIYKWQKLLVYAVIVSVAGSALGFVAEKWILRYAIVLLLLGYGYKKYANNVYQIIQGKFHFKRK